VNQIEPQDKFPTFRRIGRKLLRAAKWFGKALLVLIVVVLVVHGIASFILGRRLAAKIEAIKAKGGIVALADFGKPKVPDSENAALIYAKAFELLSSEQAGKDLDVLGYSLKPIERAKRPELWDQACSAVRKYSAVIPIVEEAAKRPKCQYPINWEAGSGAVLPHLMKIRRLEKLLYWQAVIQARDGKTDDALHSLQLSFEVGESLKDEPDIISQMVRTSATRVSSRALLDVIEQSNLTEAQARSLYDTIGERDYAAGFEKAMQCERALGMWTFDMFRRGRPLDLMGTGSPTVLAHPTIAKGVCYLWRPLLYADELQYLQYMTSLVDHASQPFRDRGLRAEPEFPWYAFVSRMISPVFNRARASTDEAQASVAGSRILLALITYKARYGAYPTNLAELRAKLGWKIEEDTFSGKDFVYRPKRAGFLLYSVGQNLKDDGARTYAERPLPTPASPVTPPGMSPGMPPASVGQPASAPPGPPPGMSPPSTPRAEGYVYKNAKGDWVADIVWEMDR